MFANKCRTVLVVEDDPGIAELEQLQLERAGFTVLSASTPEQAFEQLQSQSVNLVLLDHNLAGDVDGLEFHTQMKESGLDLPVILVTGFSNEALAIKALRAGIRDFVTKSPEYLAYLPEAVNRVLNQVETENQLAETEARLTSIIDSAKDAIIVTEGRHRIALFNRAAEDMFLCPSIQAVGQLVTRFIALAHDASNERAAENSPTPEGELTHLIHYGNRGVRADGTEFPLEASLSRARVGRKNLHTLIVRDITSRKLAEEALEERARLAALSADVGLALTTTDIFRETLQRCTESLVVNLQAAFVRIWTFNETENVLELQASAGNNAHTHGSQSRVPLGHRRVGLIAQQRKSHMTNEALTDPLIDDLAAARHEKMSTFAGYPLLVADRLVGVLALWADHPFTQPTLDAIVALANQIALGIQRRHAEEARNLFRELIDRSSDAIEVIDPNTGRFLDGNEKAWKSLGCTRDQFLAMSVPEIDPFSTRGDWGDRMDRLRREGSSVFETKHRRVEGSTFPVEVNARFVELDRGYTVAVVRDITERKLTERRLVVQHAVTRILAQSPTLAEASVEILAFVCENMEWDLGELWCLDPLTDLLRCVSSWHESVPEIAEFDAITIALTFSRGVGFPGKVWACGKTVWVPDVTPYGELPRVAAALKAGLHGAVGIPITLGKETLGVLTFFCKELGPAQDELLDTLKGIGSQIGQFIERRRAEEELRASEQRFRQIAENIREVFWLNDPISGKILYVSPAYEVIWERSCQSLYESPLSWLDAVHPEDRDEVQETFSNQTKLHREYDQVYRIMRPDKSIRWIHDRGFPIKDAAGGVYRVAGVAEDITERKLAEFASSQQQQRMEGIVNSAMDGIITVDEAQRIILMNAAAEQMFGRVANEVLGQCVELLIPERFRAGHAEHVSEFGQTGIAARAMGAFGPISGIRANGEEFPIEASISQLQIEGHKHFTVTCRDITERVRSNETRKKLEAQLQQSQKMEAFGQLAGGVAHDFNNLLTIITGYSEILLATLPKNDPRLEHAKTISEAGFRAAALTQQLLAFSRQTVLEPEVLDLNEVARDTEKLLRRLIGEDILLSTRLAPGLRKVKLDPGLLGQVLMNLAVNSRDAMPQGGELSIETSNVQLLAPLPNSTAEFRPGWYVMVALRDTGMGMSPDVKARIFEPFFTTKGVGKGTGLGLAVVHGIVAQSGGEIVVESELGHGTTFKIYFPSFEGELTAPVKADPGLTHRGTETILLVEDEENVCKLFSTSLRSQGYQVLVASDGARALQIAEKHQGEIALLLTDVVMPRMSGREVAEQLQPRFPAMKVLFMSGYTDDAVIRHGLLQDQVPFLQKPTTPSKLASKVRGVLDSSI